jgi:hypothetical protein
MFQKIRRESELSVRVGNCVCTYTHGSTVEIQAPAHWNLIGITITAPAPVLSPSNILLSPLFQCAFIPARKISARFTKMLFPFSVFTFLKMHV